MRMMLTVLLFLAFSQAFAGEPVVVWGEVAESDEFYEVQVPCGEEREPINMDRKSCVAGGVTVEVQTIALVGPYANILKFGTKVVTPGPLPNFRLPATPPHPIGCVGDRVYYGHTTAGHLIAYSAEGKELWRGLIPDFVPPTIMPPANIAEYLKGGFGSIHAVTPSLDGRFIMVEFGAENGLNQAVFTSAGELISLNNEGGGLRVSEAHESGWTLRVEYQVREVWVEDE